jgi:hypothetical protein
MAGLSFNGPCQIFIRPFHGLPLDAINYRFPDCDLNFFRGISRENQIAVVIHYHAHPTLLSLIYFFDLGYPVADTFAEVLNASGIRKSEHWTHQSFYQTGVPIDHLTKQVR